MSPFFKAPVMVLMTLMTLTFTAESSFAQDDTTLVPFDSTEAPANDLIYKGRVIDQDEAVSLKKQGVDLSMLEPVPNDSYGTTRNTNPMPMPAEGATLDYDSFMAGFGGELSFHRVVQGKNAYKLDVTTVPHRALMTRALLARLGYNQYALRRYRRLTLKFKSVLSREMFIDSVVKSTVRVPETWIVDKPANKTTLTLQDVVLEPGRTDLFNVYWAALETQFSGGRRALRATLVPISLCGATENLDSYHWTFGRVLNNSLLVSYPHVVPDQRPFDDTTIDDMRWIARKIATLTFDDWKSIVSQADYPADLAELVLNKIIAQRNDLLSKLGISALPLSYDPHVSNNSVKNGQVMREHFDGWSSSFTYGDAADPLNSNEVFNLGIMQAISSGMESLANFINTKGVIKGVADLQSDHMEKLFEDINRHFQEHPDEPYTQDVQSWGGPTASFGLTADRKVSTGTFFGSNAAIQLVDLIGFSANVGYFRGIDGIRKAFPGFQANLTVNRTYAHIKQLTSIKRAVKAPAKDFIIPNLLRDLVKILNPPKTPPAAGNGANAEAQASAEVADYTKAVESLLNKIGDGEIFTITDSVAAGVGAQIQVPLQALFPSLPVRYNQGISFGANTQGMVMRRTTLRRVRDPSTNDDYLQVYVQSMNSETGNLSLDFNSWINVAHFGAEKSKAKAKSRVFTIKSDSTRTTSDSKVIALSLQSLLRSNSDEKLRSNYPFYSLDHDFKETDWKFSFLFYQTKDLDDHHELRIRPPRESDHPFDPKNFERTLYSHRSLRRTGWNFTSMVSNIISSATKGQGSLSGGSGDNPAYTIYGRAHWTEAYTDAEITDGQDFAPVTVLRETWAGWTISKDSLNKIFDVIDQKLGELSRFGIRTPIIHRDAFASTEKLEFYNIQGTTIYHPIGVERLTAPLKIREVSREYRPGRIDKNFADEFSPSDRTVFNTLVSWYGGKDAYSFMCQDPIALASAESSSLAHSNRNVNVEFHGNRYDCIDSWAREVLDLRRDVPPASNKRAYIEWQNNMVNLLQKAIPLPKLLEIAGKDGFFLQFKISGFRKGDHEAKDSEQKEVISNYVSDSVGTFNAATGAGAFSSLADDTGIIDYEIRGLFLTGGE
jgi:hypothetical protein